MAAWPNGRRGTRARLPR